MQKKNFIKIGKKNARPYFDYHFFAYVSGDSKKIRNISFSNKKSREKKNWGIKVKRYPLLPKYTY